MKLERITEETLLGELLKVKELYQILEKYNFPCVACPFAQYELEKLKIGDIAKVYGIDSKKLIEELNNKLEKK